MSRHSWALGLAFLAVVLGVSDAFVAQGSSLILGSRNRLALSTRSRASAPLSPRMLFIEVAKEEEVPEGERKVVKARGLTVVVAKQEGKMYAFNNKCPHLGLSLKRGTITPSDDRHGVCITCPFHKSKFSLEENGKCKVWSESVFGIKGTEVIGNAVGGFIAPMAKQVNPEGKKAAPAVVYPAKVENGAILVDLPPDLSGYAQTRKFKGYLEYEDLPQKSKE